MKVGPRKWLRGKGSDFFGRTEVLSRSLMKAHGHGGRTGAPFHICCWNDQTGAPAQHASDCFAKNIHPRHTQPLVPGSALTLELVPFPYPPVNLELNRTNYSTSSITTCNWYFLLPFSLISPCTVDRGHEQTLHTLTFSSQTRAHLGRLELYSQFLVT